MDFDLSRAEEVGYDITRVHVTLTHESGAIREEDLTVEGSRAHGTISGLRVGVWDVLVELYEGETVVGSGTTSMEIEAGRTTEVHIRISLATGSANIIVEWGEGEEVLYEEDFESGTLGDEWTLGGDVPPTITDEEATSGQHSLKFTCGDSQQSWAELTLNVERDAYLKFYYKVESEHGYDFFEVYLDGDDHYISRWSGDVEWMEGKIALSPGTHVILFKFTRDYTGGYGENATWIDGVTLIATDLERRFEGHTYRYFSYLKEWHEAKEYCENLGAHLAIIESAEENEFLTENYTRPFINGRPFLGGTDEEVEGIWKWVDGRTFDEVGYTNWNPGKPDNSYDEDYLQFYNDGTWNDIDADGNYPPVDGKYVIGFLCEWDHE